MLSYMLARWWGWYKTRAVRGSHQSRTNSLWENPGTVLKWPASHCPHLWVCVRCHPTFHRPGQSHLQRPLTDRWWQVSHDEPINKCWMTHDLGASSPGEKRKPTYNMPFRCLSCHNKIDLLSPWKAFLIIQTLRCATYTPIKIPPILSLIVSRR